MVQLSEKRITGSDCQVSSGFSEARGSTDRDSFQPWNKDHDHVFAAEAEEIKAIVISIVYVEYSQYSQYRL